jgi:hypothetical protein
MRFSILDLGSALHERHAVRERKFEPELECKSPPATRNPLRYGAVARTFTDNFRHKSSLHGHPMADLRDDVRPQDASVRLPIAASRAALLTGLLT